MLSRLRRYGASAAASIISNNKFLRPFVSSSSCTFSKWHNRTVHDLTPRYVLPGTIKDLESPEFYLNYMLSQGITSAPDYNALLTALVKIRRYETVISIVEQLASQSNETYAYPDIDTWKILITCHSCVGQMYLAFSLLFDKFINAGHLPSTSTLNNFFFGLSEIHEMHKAMLFYKYVMLKGFELDCGSYTILISGFCDVGDTERAIQLLRDAEQMPRQVDQGYERCLALYYRSIIFRLCQDGLVNQACDLYFEMVVNKKIHREEYIFWTSPNGLIYQRLIFGHCLVGQFKQAIAWFREYKLATGKKKRNVSGNCVRTLVTEGEVKAAKRAAAVMIKYGLRPIDASHRSVIELYKGEVTVDKIKQMAEAFLCSRRLILL